MAKLGGMILCTDMYEEHDNSKPYGQNRSAGLPHLHDYAMEWLVLNRISISRSPVDIRSKHYLLCGSHSGHYLFVP